MPALAFLWESLFTHFIRLIPYRNFLSSPDNSYLITDWGVHFLKEVLVDLLRDYVVRTVRASLSLMG